MNIQKTTKITVLTALIALTGHSSWGAACNSTRKEDVLSELNAGLIDSIARLVENDPPSLINMARVNPELAPYVEDILFRPLLKQFNNDPQAAFFYAVQNNMIWALNYLLYHGANTYDPNANGDTALNLAAYKGNAAMVRALLKRGAGTTINQANNQGRTPLMSTIEGELQVYGTDIMQIVPMLLDAGADVNLRDNAEQTADDYLETLKSNTGGIQYRILEKLEKMIPKPTNVPFGGR